MDKTRADHTDHTEVKHAQTPERIIKGIIFDKDGTLFDYYLAWSPVFRANIDTVLETVGHPDDHELRKDLLKLLGIGEHSVHPQGIIFQPSKLKNLLVMWLFAKRRRISFRKLLAGFRKSYYESRDSIAETLPSAAASENLHGFFEALKSRNYVLGLVTSDNRESTELCMNILGIKEYFSFVSDYDDAYAQKPHPESFKAFCSRFGLKPREVAVVGDAPVDMKYGRKSGAGYLAAVLTGSRHIKQLARYADVIYDDLDHLLQDPVLFPDK
jgi:phosphoglycolate phosphatase